MQGFIFRHGAPPHYDQRFKQEVETRVQNIKSEIASDRNSIPTYISTDDVRKAVKTLKKKKACGQDCVYNEHLIHGGDTLTRICLIMVLFLCVSSKALL